MLGVTFSNRTLVGVLWRKDNPLEVKMTSQLRDSDLGNTVQEGNEQDYSAFFTVRSRARRPEGRLFSTYDSGAVEVFENAIERSQAANVALRFPFADIDNEGCR